MHFKYPYSLYRSGQAYQREQRDTHSQQQDTVPSETTTADGGPDRSPPRAYSRLTGHCLNGEYRDTVYYQSYGTVGSTATSPQSREELTSHQSVSDEYARLATEYYRLLRSAPDREEGRVQGVRGEREGGERSGEDTG